MPASVLGLSSGVPGGSAEILLVEALRAAAGRRGDRRARAARRAAAGRGTRRTTPTGSGSASSSATPGSSARRSSAARCPAASRCSRTGCWVRTPTPRSSRASSQARRSGHGAGSAVPRRRAGAQASRRRVHRVRGIAHVAVEGARAAGHAHAGLLDAHQGRRPDGGRGRGTPQSVVLDDDAVRRAADLGRHVASQLGRAWVDAEYLGPPGTCPMCRLDVVVLQGRRRRVRDVRCAGAPRVTTSRWSGPT